MASGSSACGWPQGRLRMAPKKRGHRHLCLGAVADPLDVSDGHRCPWSSRLWWLHMCRLCRRQARFHGLQIVANIVEILDFQASESLDTASVRLVNTCGNCLRRRSQSLCLPSSRHPRSSRRQLGFNKIVQVDSEIVFQLGHPGTSALCNFEFYQRDAIVGMRLAWKLLVVVGVTEFSGGGQAPQVVVKYVQSRSRCGVCDCPHPWLRMHMLLLLSST